MPKTVKSEKIQWKELVEKAVEELRPQLDYLREHDKKARTTVRRVSS